VIAAAFRLVLDQEGKNVGSWRVGSKRIKNGSSDVWTAASESGENAAYLPSSKMGQYGGSHLLLFPPPPLFLHFFYAFVFPTFAASASEGKKPASMLKRTTAHDHTSAALPSYLDPSATLVTPRTWTWFGTQPLLRITREWTAKRGRCHSSASMNVQDCKRFNPGRHDKEERALENPNLSM